MNYFKDKEIWKIYNKIDLLPNEYNTDDSPDDTQFFISAQNGNGLLKLEKALAALSLLTMKMSALQERDINKNLEKFSKIFTMLLSTMKDRSLILLHKNLQ